MRRSPTVVRRTALHEWDALVRRERRAGTAPPATEGLEVRVGGGGGGGPFTPQQFVAQPIRFASGAPGRAGRVVLVLPDGVARVTMVLPRFAGRGPHRAPLDYGQPLSRSAIVVDNVASLRLAGRGIDDLLGASVIEYAADGTVVRTVRPPR